jgi:hypothetical protein
MCASQIGFREGPNNDTKYGAWYGLNHQPYCDMGISWCADQVNASDIIGKFAYCPSHVNWFKARGQWGTTPKRGAIVFFSWGLNGVADHVGTVEVANSSPTTIEFNTSSGAVGSQSNGDGTYRRVRNPKYILGYGYPAYDTSIPAIPTTPSLSNPLQEDDMLTLILWCYSELVGRTNPPSVSEIENWISGTSGWTATQVLDGFLNAQCEPDGVVKAYKDFLGRSPESQSVIDDRINRHMTIRQVRIDVAAGAAIELGHK